MARIRSSSACVSRLESAEVGSSIRIRLAWREIARAIERMYAAEAGDDDALASDIAFHVAVLKASGNRFYMQMRDMISTALHVSIMRTNKLKGVHRASARDHEAVAKAILSGEPETARRAMRNLIQGAFDLINDKIA